MKYTGKRQFLDVLGSCRQIISIVSVDRQTGRGWLLTKEELMLGIQGITEESCIYRAQQEYFDTYELILTEGNREQLLIIMLIP